MLDHKGNLAGQSVTKEPKPHHKRYEYMKRWWKDHKDDKNLKFRLWCAANVEKRRSARRRYYWNNREKVLYANAEYGKVHNEKIREVAKNYRIATKEKRKAYSKTYHQTNYQKNRQRILFQTKQYTKAHPEVRQKTLAKRRAANINCKIVGRVIKKWKQESQFYCYYCQRLLPRELLEIEHVKPVSKGGHHSSDNVAKSCGGCNSKKGASFISEIEINGQRFLL
jgi:5-methylcytosine-specific restriction endonuclease McrA